MAHHTAGPTQGDMPSLGVIRDGRSDLPGPLAQIGLARSGVVHLIAAGRANHAGVGSWKGVSGNSHFIGCEAENPGTGATWPAVQLDAYMRVAAAVLRHLKRDASWCCGHKEYATPPGRKIDPAGIDMNQFRQKVAERLAGEELTVAQYDEIMRQLRAINDKLDAAEKNRWRPSTKRIRLIFEHLGLSDSDD